MSTPPLPAGLERYAAASVANHLHSVSIHLLRSARRVDRETGLSGPRLSLLSVVVFGGPKGISELAAAEMVSRPAITKIVNALVALRLARRERSSTDRRRVLVYATARGRKLMEQGRKRRVETIAALLEDLSKHELKVVEDAAHLLAALVVA